MQSHSHLEGVPKMILKRSEWKNKIKTGFSTFYDVRDYGYGRSGEHSCGFIDLVILLVTSYGEGGCGSSDVCMCWVG